MKRFLAIAVGLVVLFVVVCPITPTPIAVVAGKAQVQQAALAVVSVVFTSAPRPDRPIWMASAEPVALLSPADVLDLTCVRLC